MFLLILLLLIGVRRRRMAAKAKRGLDGEMHALMHELSAMIAKAEQQLDARARRLERLLGDADERIARLERLNRAPDPRDGHNGADASPGMPSPMISSADATELDPRHAQIYALSEEGLSIAQIADRLGRPKGEVELILALRPRGRATPVARASSP
ncbi:MAG: hypothetical protein ABIP55_11400 [Tepidisphaeraceae bacterium]